jgi:hypothetical protein
VRRAYVARIFRWREVGERLRGRGKEIDDDAIRDSSSAANDFSVRSGRPTLRLMGALVWKFAAAYSFQAASAFGVSFEPLKFGGRFSRKAVNASLASADRTRAENSSFSSLTACSS